MPRKDWSFRKADLFNSFATSINELNDNQYDLGDTEFVSQLESLYESLPEEWLESLETNPKETTKEYLAALQSQGEEESSPQYAKKGAKLQYLKKLKTPTKKSAKCKCGCEMESGGKICKCCGGGKLYKHQKGGKVIKGQKGLDTDESWEDSKPGNKSMNPKDWIKSKKEAAQEKSDKQAQDTYFLRKPKAKKVNTEIVPLKNEKKDSTKLVNTKEKGGDLVLIKKNTNGKKDYIKTKLNSKQEENKAFSKFKKN